MDSIKRYRKLSNNSKDNVVIKYIRNFISRCLMVVIIFLFMAIFVKSDIEYKDIIYNNIYKNNLSFTSFKNFYNKYLGGISFIDKMVDTREVFNSKLEYKNVSKFYDGASLEVSNNYLVPVIETGIVVYIGNKDNYGNSIVIQGMDEVEITYGNISNSSLKLYDYIEKGELLGEVNGNNLYLVYSKDGNNLDYEKYLK